MWSSSAWALDLWLVTPRTMGPLPGELDAQRPQTPRRHPYHPALAPNTIATWFEQLVLTRTEPACLVIADISGYSGYLIAVELDHAQDVLADLMGTVVGALRPSFELAKLEGDAAFVYLSAATVDGPGFRDVIERCYFTFQRRLRDIRQASTCECKACDRIPSLDLKFVAHHGTIARQRMAGRDELVGGDVIVVHRLLKNSVVEKLGIAAYVLYTEAMLAAMGVRDPKADGFVEHLEVYETVGETVGWVSDLQAAWAAQRERERVLVPDVDAIVRVTATARAAQDVAWEWATSPVRRIRWEDGLTDIVEETSTGRRGIGTVNHCMHGQQDIVEEVLDWQPPHYLTKRITMPMRGMPRPVVTMELSPTDDGTMITWRVGRPKSTKDRVILKAMEGQLRRTAERDAAGLIPLLEADAAERIARLADEPEVPASNARHLREPVRRSIASSSELAVDAQGD